ncbi:MAG: NUDIX domain-containing protein [Acidimicrobiales bacterium]|nr:NUDIX domain-containing protein [Acidimicrobiales bacterium]
MAFDLSGAAEVQMRDAATVVLARDGADGLEVFMLKRNMNSDFVGGAYVFPGGAVDPEDRDDDLEAVCEGRTDADASARLGVEEGGLAYWVAAIRESFEEAGVLLAYDRSGKIVDLDGDGDGDPDGRWFEHRSAVDGGTRRLVEVCGAEGLRLAVDGMHYFAHWVTPAGAPRRYDTRFFVAAAPAGQTPLHDDHEVIANEWLRPADGLARALAGELTMLPPTIASLRAVQQFGTVAELLSAAQAITSVPRIEPRVVAVGEMVHILMPGEPGYDGEPFEPGDPSDWQQVSGQATTGFGASS